MARFFIDRPIFAIVVSLFLTIGGLIAAFNLPISQYPQISPPQVSVSANYTGANASVVEESIAQVLETGITGIENMQYMTSSSSDNGMYSLTVQFDLGTDIDMATVQVQNKVAQAQASLPQDVINTGVTTSKVSPDMALVVAVHSPNGTYDSTYLKNYCSIYMVDDAKRVGGVGDIAEFGSNFAMRIWLKPDKMAQYGVTVTDVQNAVASQNIQAPAGSVGQPPSPAGQEHQYTVQVQGRLANPTEFSNIIIRSESEGSSIRIKDVAKVELASKDFFYSGDLNHNDAAIFAVQLTPDANALQTVADVRAVFDAAAKDFPEDMEIKYIVDNTIYVKESLKEVGHTFFEALLLVLIIVFIFLQSVRATLIPMLAVPVSLIGTFAAFLILGFSINTLTLFAMVLAIGLVVDDAIVVIEAVEYNMRYHKMAPKEATIKAMQEVSGPVVAIAFVLASVFIPVAFMSGTTGVLYRQFALTIAVSMGLSAIIALSLTPALCTLLLKPHEENAHSGKIQRYFRLFNIGFEKLTRQYGKILAKLTAKIKLGLVSLLVIVVLAVGLAQMLPTSFVPDEDQGYYLGVVILPESTNLIRTREVANDIIKPIKGLPGVEDTLIITGYNLATSSLKSSASSVFVPLKPWEERTSEDLQIGSQVAKAFGVTMSRPEATTMFFTPPSLPGLGAVGGFSFIIQDRSGGTIEDLAGISDQFIAAIQKRPEITSISSNFSINTPSYKLEVDREKVEKLGVKVSDVFTTLQAFLGGYPINDYNAFGRTYKVVMQAGAEYRSNIEDTKFLFVRSAAGEMIPLDTLLKPVSTSGPTTISRFNGYRSVQFNGSPASGYSSGEAMAALEEVAKQVLPEGYTYDWTGQSREEKAAGSTTALIFAMAIIFVFLCLAALYESWSIPFVVLLSVPTGLFGCFLFQYFRGFENDIYMQIGLIMLIGLAAKNAILIVEYAKVRTDAGMEPIKAAIEASKLRLRPIIMTSLAFIIGCIPLAIATGAGAGSRTSMGNAVVGGMFTATTLGIFLIPVLFVAVNMLMRRFSKKDSNIDLNQ
ncbi:multidrug efflux RND transporter permease subunit [Selenomonadales bacterium OttesenSCG-928-I06]|nr:multidrug efflux RND transporter permease subunit [Selenomonadales bacterium OttesenSCG-928-I06]